MNIDPTIDWALSSSGTAVATWVADIVAVIALLVALRVALVERRRANDEIRQQITSAAKARHRFIKSSLDIMAEAHCLIDIESNRTFEIEADAKPVSTSTLPHALEPLLDALQALQIAAPPEGDIILTLARSARILRDACDHRGVSRSEPIEGYRSYLERLRGDIYRRIEQLAHLLSNPGPLPEELSILQEYR